MGYKFSLVLSREVTEGEVATLQEAGCVSAVFGTDSLPTDADVTVTKMDFDDTTSPSLAEAIESALAAVNNVPDLNVPGLTVPAQPAEATTGEPDEVAGERPDAEESRAEEPSTEKTAARTTGTRKAGTKRTGAKTTAKKTAKETGSEPAGEPDAAQGDAPSSADLVDAAAESA